MIPNQNSPELLRQEILAEARRESDGIIHRAQAAMAAFLSKAAADADQDRCGRLAGARAEAARRKEIILENLTVEARRLRATRVEKLLQAVHEEARRRLMNREGFDYREAVTALAADAMKRMSGNAFIVNLSAADCTAFGDGLAEEIAGRVGRSPLNVTIANDSTTKVEVLVIQDVEGRLVWDNSLSARLERLWPDLRRQLAAEASLIPASRPSGGGA